jgi:RNA polymerase sigma-70 factor (ECF subfamily)
MDLTTNAPAAATDKALINLVLAGNAEYFGLLMDRHLAAVRHRIRCITRTTWDTDDIMQEVQLKIWTHLGTYRSEASFRTWMTRIAINESLQFHRKANRVPPNRARSELDELISPGESPLQACLRAERTQALKTAVEHLPAKHKQALILHNLHELSLKETAWKLNATTPAIKTQLFRAKARLSKALLQGKRGCAPEIAA